MTFAEAAPSPRGPDTNQHINVHHGRCAKGLRDGSRCWGAAHDCFRGKAIARRLAGRAIEASPERLPAETRRQGRKRSPVVAFADASFYAGAQGRLGLDGRVGPA
jgi:hypothetical protein